MEFSNSTPQSGRWFDHPETSQTLRHNAIHSDNRGRHGIWVHNLGGAIDPAMRPTIFEPMMRGAPPGHRRSVGLGLYIVREIAYAHGGTLDYVSSQLEGTTFVIEWPR